MTEKRISVMVALRCAEQMVDFFEKEYSEDRRLREAMMAVERWLKEPCFRNEIEVERHRHRISS